MGGAMSVDPADQPVTAPKPANATKEYFELFLISFVILFFELTCIRWFASSVMFLTFFTNLVLMACFLGMSVGCLAAARKQELINTTIPLLVWTVLLSCAVLVFHFKYGRILVDVGGQGSPQQVFFGTESVSKDPTHFIIPIEVIAGLFFVLIAVAFTGPGQVMGRAFNRLPNHLAAYSVNILGSLTGIAVFGIAAFWRASPAFWFALSLGPCLYFVKRSRLLQTAGVVGLVVVMVLFFGNGVRSGEAQLFWSPYYKVVYYPQEKRIGTNNIEHQGMVPVAQKAPAYMLAHLLNRDAGNRPFEDALIVGAGSGNDVEAALIQGAKHVDAVEIDPLMYEIGRREHPEHPYADSRVTIHIDDGRNFTRKTDRTYDLVSYAVVDSLVLHSGYSSLRLESFLFTEQAFRDIKARLKPGGTFAMYNLYRQGWVVGRLAKMAEKVFGSKPLVISLPYQEKITAGDGYANRFTLLMIGNTGAQQIEAIREQFKSKQFFWVNENPGLNQPINAYGPRPPIGAGERGDGWQKIGPAEVDTAGITRVPTDDWPFLYLRDPTIPALNVRWLLMVAVLSLGILFWFAPARTLRPNWQMFFLGAGFMLLETKGVVQMALLFGSTWIVNSVIFAAILAMILMSNLFVFWFSPKRPWIYYGLLIAALAVNACVPMDYYLGLEGATRSVLASAVVFTPIFFAGIVFAMAFRDSQHPDVDIGSNIAGVILGGLSENLSLVVGFNFLLVIAASFYLLSALTISGPFAVGAFQRLFRRGFAAPSLSTHGS
jgi:SAM-dependent methyltransferase